VHIQLGWYGPWEDRAKRISDAIAFAKHGVELDDREPAARVSLGRALALSGAVDMGVEELRTAVELDPSFAQAHFALGQALGFLERHDEALHEINEALRLSPRDPHLWTFLNARALAHYLAGDLQQAEADARAALRQPVTTFIPAMTLVAILGRQGKTAEAREAIADLDRLRPGFTCADACRQWYFGDRPFRTQRFIDQFATDVRKAGLRE
jgi:tetratricopeptide (TPR) repeat protein